MEKYPLKIMLTNIMTTRVGIGSINFNADVAILLIEDLSPDKIKECVRLLNTPDENSNNRMLVMDLVRNNKYYRVALSREILPKFLGITIFECIVLVPDDEKYKDADNYLINRYNVFDMEVLPESECLDLQKSTLEWFEDTHKYIRDEELRIAEIYLSTTYNGRTVILRSAVNASTKEIEYQMQYLDSISKGGNEADMAAVVDEVEAGNLQFRLVDMDIAIKETTYVSGHELLRDLINNGCTPPKLYEIATKDQG